MHLGHIAQSAERFAHIEEVTGSSPVMPTMIRQLRRSASGSPFCWILKSTVVSVKMRNTVADERVFDALSDCEKLKDLEMTTMSCRGILNLKCKLARLVIDSKSYRNIDISSCDELKSLDIGIISEIGIDSDFLSLPELEEVSVMCRSSAIARDVISRLVHPRSVQLFISPLNPNDIMGPPSDDYGEGYNNLDYPAEYDCNVISDMTQFENLKHMAVTYWHPLREKAYNQCLMKTDELVCRTLSERCDEIVLENVPFKWSVCKDMPNKVYVNRRFSASQLLMMSELARKDIVTEPSVQEYEIYKDKIAEDTGKMCATLYRVRLASLVTDLLS